MVIVVPIKQVPETSNVQMDSVTGVMIRSGSKAILNPLDLYAIESALRYKEACDARVIAVTMGPQSAMKVLKEAIAMGCDDAVHISDRAFAGADTWSTSYTLAKAIAGMGKVDLIITGERATDGDTGQVGPEIASWLNLPLVTYVSQLIEMRSGSMMVKRMTEEGYQKLEVTLPALITVLKEVATVRLSTLKGKMRAMDMIIPTRTVKDLDVEPSYLGLKGSPTKVVKIEQARVKRDALIIEAMEADKVPDAVISLFDFLEDKQLLEKGESR